jgi:hypothetical protein
MRIEAATPQKIIAATINGQNQLGDGGGAEDALRMVAGDAHQDAVKIKTPSAIRFPAVAQKE